MEDMFNKSHLTASLSDKELAIKVARQLAGVGAANIKVLELTALASWCDYLIIATSSSNVQGQSCIRDAAQLMMEYGLECGGVKPARDDLSGWLLLDGKSLVVNLFNQEMRDFYDLERMWAAAPLVYEQL